MSVDMNKTIAEASLDNMHDIILPDAVGFFPLAPGWYIVLALVVALLFHFAVKTYKHYKRSLYRREALKEFHSYKEKDIKSAIALILLAKRVGMSAYGRENIANLSEDSWWDFMQQHSKSKVSTEERKNISKLLYDDTYEMQSREYDTIKQFVLLWINSHKEQRDV